VACNNSVPGLPLLGDTGPFSSDGEKFKTVVDKTGNDKDNSVEFDEIDPV